MVFKNKEKLRFPLLKYANMIVKDLHRKIIPFHTNANTANSEWFCDLGLVSNGKFAIQSLFFFYILVCNI